MVIGRGEWCAVISERWWVVRRSQEAASVAVYHRQSLRHHALAQKDEN